MISINRNEKVKCEDCSRLYTRQNAARHRRRCVRGVISCPECKYCTYNHHEMSFRTSKKHVNSTPKSLKCVSCEKYLQVSFHFNNIARKIMDWKRRKRVIMLPIWIKSWKTRSIVISYEMSWTPVNISWQIEKWKMYAKRFSVFNFQI